MWHLVVDANKRLGTNQIKSLNKRRKVQADGDAEMSDDEVCTISFSSFFGFFDS